MTSQLLLQVMLLLPSRDRGKCSLTEGWKGCSRLRAHWRQRAWTALGSAGHSEACCQ